MLQEVSENKRFAIDLLMVALLGLLLFSPFLGKRDFWSSGEARVAQAARQMLRSGDWLKPRIGGKPRWEKPPLAYWLTATTGLWAADITPFNSRIPSVLAGIGVLLLVYCFGRDLWGCDAGIRAALVLGTTIAFWRESRNTGIEMHLLFFNLLALYTWWRYRFSVKVLADGQTSIYAKWLLLCYFALGFSFLDKGPVGPMLVGTIITVLLIATKNQCGNRGKTAWHIVGIAIFCAVALPWYIAVLIRVPGAWDIWLRQSVGRLGGFAHPHSSLYFLGVIASDAQPWLIFALGAIFLGPDKAERNRTRHTWLLPLVWVGTTLLFFSIPTDKKSYYVMMAYPGMALAATWTMIRLRQLDEHGGVARFMRWLLCGLAVVIVAVGVALQPLYLFLSAKGGGKFAQLTGQWPTVIITAIILTLGGYALWKRARIRHFSRAARVLWVCTVLMIGVYISLLPTLNRHRATRFVCDQLGQTCVLTAKDAVYIYHTPGIPIFTYYLDHQVTRLSQESLRELCAAPDRGMASYASYICMPTGTYQDLPDQLRKCLVKSTAPLPFDRRGRAWYCLQKLTNYPHAQQILRANSAN